MQGKAYICKHFPVFMKNKTLTAWYWRLWSRAKRGTNARPFLGNKKSQMYWSHPLKKVETTIRLVRSCLPLSRLYFSRAYTWKNSFDNFQEAQHVQMITKSCLLNRKAGMSMTAVFKALVQIMPSIIKHQAADALWRADTIGTDTAPLVHDLSVLTLAMVHLSPIHEVQADSNKIATARIEMGNIKIQPYVVSSTSVMLLSQ